MPKSTDDASGELKAANNIDVLKAARKFMHHLAKALFLADTISDAGVACRNSSSRGEGMLLS